MVKKKVTKPRKKKSSILKSVGMGALKGTWFLMKTPYYLGKGIYKASKYTKTKVEESSKKKAVKQKREAITAIHEDFKVIHTKDGDYLEFENKVNKADSKIGVILGARGTGKTAFGMKFLENSKAKYNKKCYAMGFDANELPSWITAVNNIDEIGNNAIVLIDEGGILFSSRDSMSNANKLLSDLILVARHKNLTILFISQNCLPENQKILTPNGIKTLKELKEKDLVYAFDFKKNKLISTKAKKSCVGKKKVVKIHLEDGRILKSSLNHKWVIYGKDGLSEKRAKDLNKVDDCLIDVSSHKKEL